MKIFFLKNKIIYISILVILITTIFLISIYEIKISKKSNIDITYIDENNMCDDNCKIEDKSKKRQDLLIQKYKDKKLIALTFDDGPGKYTSALVDELKKRNIPVTFFLLGENAIKFPSVIKFEIDAGNEVGIHSYKHSLFTKLTDTQISEQIDKTKYIILNEVDIDIPLIRVPYGAINKKVEKVLEEKKLTNVLWTVDSKDWKFRNVDKIYNYVLKNIKGNDIILMHDIFDTSVTSALNIVDKLESECYTFVTVSDLLKIEKIVGSKEK